MYRLIVTVLPSAGMFAAAVAFAQAPAPATAPGTPSRLEYQSAFDGYRAHKELETQSWRESNEEAGALGGHVGQLKGSSSRPGEAPKSGTPPSASGSPTPASGARSAPAAANTSAPALGGSGSSAHGAHAK